MKLYTHKDGKKSIRPEVTPKGYEIFTCPKTFELIWRKVPLFNKIIDAKDITDV